MHRTTRLTLVCLALALGLFPLTLGKPGLPLLLRDAEATHYLAAMSLAHDRDLRCDARDLHRLFDEFPVGTERLSLASDDGFRTSSFAVPLVHPLLLAAAAAAAGANGMVAVHMLLVVGLITLAARILRRTSEEIPAVLFAAGFFLLSPVFAYAFRLQGDVLVVALAFLAVDLAMAPPPGEPDRRPALGAVGSGLCLALGAYSQPLVAILALPIGRILAAGGRRRLVVAWLASTGLTLAALAGLSQALTGHLHPLVASAHRDVAVHDPSQLDPLPPPAPSGAGSGPARVALDAAYFLVGRHTGLVVYFPFAVLALALWLAGPNRAGWRAWLLAAPAGALALVAWLPMDWAGGPEAIGNRYLLAIYPAFLFLIPRVRPSWIPLVGYTAGGLFLGSLLFTPFGAPVPWPDAQTHARAAPLGIFPVERTLLTRLPGYMHLHFPGLTVHVRRDLAELQADEIWVHGAIAVDLWLETSAPPADLVFLLRDLAPHNRIELRFGKGREVHEFGEVGPRGEVRRLHLAPGSCFSGFGLDQSLCRLRVDAVRGEWPAWRGSTTHTFYVGAALTWLGTSASLALDPYRLEWGTLEAPSATRAGQDFTVTTAVTNRSGVTWPDQGAARIKLAYHWLAPDGTVAVQDGLRTELPHGVAPGETVRLEQEVRAPSRPGRYTLAIDPVWENVAWFSEHGVAPETLAIDVLAAPTPTPSPAP